MRHPRGNPIVRCAFLGSRLLLRVGAEAGKGIVHAVGRSLGSSATRLWTALGLHGGVSRVPQTSKPQVAAHSFFCTAPGADDRMQAGIDQDIRNDLERATVSALECFKSLVIMPEAEIERAAQTAAKELSKDQRADAARVCSVLLKALEDTEGEGEGTEEG